MRSSYSAIIPAFNAAATIREALASVFSQSIPPAEVIVVDDGSTDATADIVAGVPGVILMRQPNQGPGAATTAGLARAATPFVATLDADDLWLPEKSARQFERFEAEPDVAGVFTLARQFRDGGAADPDGNGVIQRLWTRTTLMFRTDAARAVGAFVDLPGLLGETIDWLARSHDLGHRHVMVEEILALRRIRPGSLSYDRHPDRNRGYLFAVRAAIARKKQRQVDKGTESAPE